LEKISAKLNRHRYITAFMPIDIITIVVFIDDTCLATALTLLRIERCLIPKARLTEHKN
jgi:hypothetical protein